MVNRRTRKTVDPKPEEPKIEETEEVEEVIEEIEEIVEEVENENDDESTTAQVTSEKKERTSENCYRFLIPAKLSGKVIGKKGENINKLRKLYDMDIFLKDSKGPERIIRLKSPNVDNICKCIRDISATIQVELCEQLKLKDGQTEARLLIHSHQAGAIIGKAGARIKEVRNETNTAIYMNGDCCPGSNERIVQVAGKPEDVYKAMLIVINDVNQREPKTTKKFYDPDNHSPSIKYGGFSKPETNYSSTGYSRPVSNNLTFNNPTPVYPTIPGWQPPPGVPVHGYTPPMYPVPVDPYGRPMQAVYQPYHYPIHSMPPPNDSGNSGGPYRQGKRNDKRPDYFRNRK